MHHNLKAIKEDMEESADTCEELMQVVIDVQQSRETERDQALAYVEQTQEEVDRLLAKAYGILCRIEGSPFNPLETPGWQRSIHFGRGFYLNQVDRKHEHLRDQGLDCVYDELREARLRNRVAQENRADADFDLDFQRAMVRQAIAILREIFTGLIAHDVASYSTEDQQEGEDLRAYAEDLYAWLRQAEGYIIRRVPHSSISQLTPGDINKARVEAREHIDFVLGYFAKREATEGKASESR